MFITRWVNALRVWRLKKRLNNGVYEMLGMLQEPIRTIQILGRNPDPVARYQVYKAFRAFDQVFLVLERCLPMCEQQTKRYALDCLKKMVSRMR